MRNSQATDDTPELQADFLIVGGGAAGLWLLNRLTDAGHAVALVEQEQLGGGQTAACQGILHGGVKYALGGRLTGSGETIAQMPQRWRACLEGRGELDLRATRCLSDTCYLFSAGSPASALASLLASQALHGRVQRLKRGEEPPFFRHDTFHGTVYALDEVVIDPASLVRDLARGSGELLLQQADVARHLARNGSGFLLHADGVRLRARRLLLAAGSGNAELLAALGHRRPQMQRRPLHQVYAKLRHPNPVYGHCVTGLTHLEPELTLTSQPLAPDEWLLCIGGGLASQGVERDPAAQIDVARATLVDRFPWLEGALDHWRTLRIDRAEPAQADGGRPGGAYVHSAENVITVWPTKLALLPDLGDQLLATVGPPETGAAQRAQALRAGLARAPKPGLAGLPAERAA